MYRTIDLRNTQGADRADTHRSAGSHPNEYQQSLDPHRIAFIIPVKDEIQYGICLRYLDALHVPSEYTVEKIAVLGGSSMAEVFQRAMEASTARYKIYLHVDGYVVHRGLLPELLNLFRTYPRLGMIGVEGATRLPVAVLYSVNNPLHIYGRIWNYRRPGGPSSLLGPANRRRLHFSRFRSFVGDYLPAATVDGFFMATQYDLPWVHTMFGFDLYETVQAMEFIKAGLEVGLARQETIWCVHWGPLQEPSREQFRRRQIGLRHKAAVFRQLYPEFIGVPAGRLYKLHRGAAGWLDMAGGEFGDGATDQQAMPRDVKSPDPPREGLGVVIVSSNGREVLLRALRGLLQQCELLKEIECQVVVVDSATADGTVEALRREFPQAAVITTASTEGPARGFNRGLRHLGFPRYALVMHDDIEFPTGTLFRMVSYLRDHPSIAGVSPSFINPDGTAQSQRMAIFELVSRRPERPQPISFVGTTCALVRGEVFFDVGLYDERFYSHHQDLDWSLRAKSKGHRFTLLPEAKVIHYRSEGAQESKPAVFAESLVGNLGLLHKHGGRRWATVLYWAQRLLVRWRAFRWRSDSKALRQLREVKAREDGLYRRFRDENRRPQLL